MANPAYPEFLILFYYADSPAASVVKIAAQDRQQAETIFERDYPGLHAETIARVEWQR